MKTSKKTPPKPSYPDTFRAVYETRNDTHFKTLEITRMADGPLIIEITEDLLKLGESDTKRFYCFIPEKHADILLKELGLNKIEQL